MYYILNETDQIIAADDNFLTYCGVNHIDELSVKIAKGDMTFTTNENETITLNLNDEEETFPISTITLSSLLGHLTLVSVSPLLSETLKNELASDDESTAFMDSIVKEDENTVAPDNIDDIKDEASTLSSEKTDSINQEDKITLGDHLLLDDDIMSLKEETPDDTKDETSDEISSLPELPSNDELFDLVVDEEPSKEEVSQQSDEPKLLTLDESPIDLGITDQNDEISLDIFEEEVSEIIIDSHSISQKIGISNDDYQNFLNDFIDTALSLEKDLQSDNPDTRNDAITTLSHLSDVLHLTAVGDILTNIKNNDNNTEDIASLYSTLSRITTKKEEEVTAPVEEKFESEEETLELFDTPDAEPMIQEVVTPRKKPSGNSFGTISLEGIQPKHFDFQLEEAAKDLSLPVELIEEFVHDFIDQAHIETKKMLEAYEEGDLETIQKIGHLLKGASSNLRINALSDTLYKIQFCEDSSNLEHLIKDYWAHFLSFENQINTISH